jgi:hypothetical protein
MRALSHRGLLLRERLAGPGVRFGAALALLVLAGWSVAQGPTAQPQSLSRFTPTGPLLVLESRNLAALVRDWNTSDEKRLWLESDNYQVFSRSKLFLRLGDAHKEFAAAAGFPADMPLVESVAGAESIVALYDIGNLEFLYVTRLPNARSLESLLWQTRANFEPRNAAGQAYYVKTDPESARLVAFAATDDYLLLATREDLLAGALALLAGRQGVAPVESEGWYRDAVGAARVTGDPRLVLDMEALARSPHFRSYWIQQNISELRQYRAAVCDIVRTSGEIREERVFLRREDAVVEAPAAEGTAAVAQLARLVEDGAGLYRIWARPAVEQTLAILESKVLAPQAGAGPPSVSAPQVVMTGGVVGSEAALETRIDEPPPPQSAGIFDAAALRAILEAQGVDGMLQVQSSRKTDAVFVENEGAVVLLAGREWEQETSTLGALRSAVAGLWTTAQLGAQWTPQTSAAGAYWKLDGLTPLFAASQGRYLVIANAAQPLENILTRLAAPASGDGAAFLAGFRHERERENYMALMRRLDYLQANRFGDQAERQPAFFSDNIASLSRALGRAESLTVRSDDQGRAVSQTVTYHLRP